jgi:Flp pilus assembly protein TadB
MTIQIVVAIFFIAVLFGVFSIYMWYATVKASPQYELRRRLGKLAILDEKSLPSDLSIELLSQIKPVDKFLFKFSLYRRIDRLIDNAGIKIDTKIFLFFVFIIAAAFFAFGIVLDRGIFLSFIFVAIILFTTVLFLKVKRDRRLMKFTEQLPDTLDIIARSLKAGHSILSAIQMVGNEMAEPIAGIFKTSYEEQRLGLPMSESLALMLERMESVDLRLFITAVNIHSEVGGNLAETLERLAHTIRERLKIRRQIRVYTAQGRLSGYILTALPIFMALMLFMIAPDYLTEFVKLKTGKIAIGVAIAMQILGFIVIRKLRQRKEQCEGGLMPIIVLVILVFFAIASVLFSVLYIVIRKKTEAEERLEGFVERAEDVSIFEKRLTPLQKFLGRLGANVPLKPSDQGKYMKQLVAAGIKKERLLIFLGSKLGFTILLPVLYLVFHGIPVEPSMKMRLLYTLIFAIVGFLLPTYWLRFKVKQRQTQIFLDLPDVIDLMMVCVESGVSMDASMVKVCRDPLFKESPVVKEMSISLQETRAGKPRMESLRDMGERTMVADVISFAAMLIQTERLGTSLVQAMRVHADSLRTIRRQRAEEAAAKIAIKLLFPLAFFIFPALLVVILGPAVIRIAKLFSQM